MQYPGAAATGNHAADTLGDAGESLLDHWHYEVGAKAHNSDSDRATAPRKEALEVVTETPHLAIRQALEHVQRQDVRRRTWERPSLWDRLQEPLSSIGGWLGDLADARALDSGPDLTDITRPIGIIIRPSKGLGG